MRIRMGQGGGFVAPLEDADVIGKQAGERTGLFRNRRR